MQRSAALEKIRVLETELSRDQVRCEILAQRLADTYQQGMAGAAAECRRAEDYESLQKMPVETLEKEIEELRRRVAAISDVNLGAIKEYDQLKERHEFLATQRTDLVKALDDLHKVIRKINQVTQERFSQTLAQVNDRMQEVFPKLFEGGSGKAGDDRTGKPPGNGGRVSDPSAGQEADPHEPAFGRRKSHGRHRLHLFDFSD